MADAPNPMKPSWWETKKSVVVIISVLVVIVVVLIIIIAVSYSENFGNHPQWAGGAQSAGQSLDPGRTDSYFAIGQNQDATADYTAVGGGIPSELRAESMGGLGSAGDPPSAAAQEDLAIGIFTNSINPNFWKCC